MESTPISLIKELFMSRSTALQPAHREEFLWMTVTFLSDLVASAEFTLAPHVADQLAAALPSLFSVPTASGEPLPGIVDATVGCSDALKCFVASTILLAGGAVPSPWDVDPRFRAAATFRQQWA